jgi:hypothetical protein
MPTAWESSPGCQTSSFLYLPDESDATARWRLTAITFDHRARLAPARNTYAVH